MTNPNNKDQTQASGCLSIAAGCLVASLIFPFSVAVAMILTFALGLSSMSCALPNRCSKADENAKVIIATVIVLGGGFGIPLAVGSLVGRAVKHSKSREDKESY